MLQAEIGNGAVPKLSSSSSSAAGAVRSWDTVTTFMQEVAMGRLYDGVHYRNSSEVGTAMGLKVGALVVKSSPKRLAE